MSTRLPIEEMLSEPEAGSVSDESTGVITRLLMEWRSGDERALEELTPLVYRDLQRLAGSYLQHEREGHTLETQDLIHEAFLRLLDQQRVDWQSRAHFFAIAAQMMRRILVDHARRRSRVKRGGGHACSTAAPPKPVSPIWSWSWWTESRSIATATSTG